MNDQLLKDAQLFLSSIELTGRGAMPNDNDSLSSDEERDELGDQKIERVSGIESLRPTQLDDARCTFLCTLLVSFTCINLFLFVHYIPILIL